MTDWPTLTAAVDRRSRYKCEAGVGGICTRSASHYHHRKMRSQGGPHTVANLLHVCMACHQWIHANPALSYASGWLIHGYAPNPD